MTRTCDQLMGYLGSHRWSGIQNRHDLENILLLHSFLISAPCKCEINFSKTWDSGCFKVSQSLGIILLLLTSLGLGVKCQMPKSFLAVKGTRNSKMKWVSNERALVGE